jgi:hypothetical protein
MKRTPIVGAVLGAAILAATGCAEASDSTNAVECTAPPPPLWYHYPTANWEPFFRRHLYRYGPILACSHLVTPRPFISIWSDLSIVFQPRRDY